MQQLEHEIGRTLVRTHVVDREQVRVVERPRRLRLLLESPETIGIAARRVAQDLDRHFPRQPRVPRPVHLAHAPRPEGRQDLVGPEPHAR